MALKEKLRLMEEQRDLEALEAEYNAYVELEPKSNFDSMPTYDAAPQSPSTPIIQVENPSNPFVQVENKPDNTTGARNITGFCYRTTVEEVPPIIPSAVSKSTNEHLLTGPELTNALPGVLSGFPEHPIAIIAEKTFHHFHVNSDDRKLHCSLGISKARMAHTKVITTPSRGLKVADLLKSNWAPGPEYLWKHLPKPSFLVRLKVRKLSLLLPRIKKKKKKKGKNYIYISLGSFTSIFHQGNSIPW